MAQALEKGNVHVPKAVNFFAQNSYIFPNVSFLAKSSFLKSLWSIEKTNHVPFDFLKNSSRFERTFRSLSTPYKGLIYAFSSSNSYDWDSSESGGKKPKPTPLPHMWLWIESLFKYQVTVYGAVSNARRKWTAVHSKAPISDNVSSLFLSKRKKSSDWLRNCFSWHFLCWKKRQHGGSFGF